MLNELSALASAPLAWEPHSLAATLALVKRVVSGGTLDPSRLRAELGLSRSRSRPSGRATVVIPLHGILSHRRGFFTELGFGTSLESFRRMLDSAVDDDKVSTVVIDVDSPGGGVTGVEETAQAVRLAREKKRVVAAATGMMASAAYWIGAGASEVIASPSSFVGSIGVYLLHEDMARYFEELGIRHTLIKAGKFKTEGNEFEPLTDEAAEHFQADVDTVYRQFVADVALGRRVAPGRVAQGFGQGRLLGAREALRQGLSDRVAPIESIVQTERAPSLLGSAYRAHERRRRQFALEKSLAASGAPVIDPDLERRRRSLREQRERSV